MSNELLNKIIDKLDSMDKRLEAMEGRQDEMYQILRGLEENKEINKAKIDKLEVEVRHLKHHDHDLILKTGEAKAVSSQ